jgi:hypothetical protein
MIDRLEIMEFSREVGLAPEVVEKDYVLGWSFAGIRLFLFFQKSGFRSQNSETTQTSFIRNLFLS